MHAAGGPDVDLGDPAALVAGPLVAGPLVDGPASDDVLRLRVRTAVTGPVRPGATLRRLGALVVLYALVSVVGLWTATAAGPLAWLAVWPVLTFLLVSSGAVVHEATHEHLTGRRPLDAAIGSLFGAIVFLPFATYRVYHLQHHVDTCGPTDSEGEPYAFASRAGYVLALVFGGWRFVFTLTAAMFASVIGRPPAYLRTARQRQSMVDGLLVWCAAALALAAALVLVPHVAITCWLVPVALLLSGPLSVLLLPEHLGATGPGPKAGNTRTCRSNALVRWVFLNTNFHTVHHVAAMVPWPDLPAAHAAINADVLPGWNESGYLRFHRSVWRSIGTAAPPPPPVDGATAATTPVVSSPAR